ncbi:MAG: hypothetical protein IJ760_01710 [Bacteroidales bacterium]|nr:hypothetical protein [Bacteroidales bacterium]
MDNNKRRLINELTDGMQRLCAVANRVVALKGEVNRIEVDLLLEDLRRLYDVALRLGDDELPQQREEAVDEGQQAVLGAEEQHVMAMLGGMAAMPQQPAVEVPVQPEAEEQPPAPRAEQAPAEEPAATEPAAATQEEAPVQTMEQLEHNDNGLLFEDIVIDPPVEQAAAAESAEEEEKEEEHAQQEEPKAEPADEPTATAAGQQPEQHAEAAAEQRQASLLDYLQQQPVRTLGEQLASRQPLQGTLERKVEDLRTVININDRFTFMSELFHNNIKAYNDFILDLNALRTREEALAAVDAMASRLGWDRESAAVAGFMRILDKKF